MVLIIDTAKRNARAVSDIFYYMGILSYAVTPAEALSEASTEYKAALILEPENLPDVEDYVKRLKSYSYKLPVFAITDSELPRSTLDLFDGHFKDSMYSSEIAEGIITYQAQRGLPIIGCYRLAGIDASCDINDISAFGKSLGFTKTEKMILRYLISSYPTPKSAASILKYAFKPSRKPEVASIRTHVSVMNKKFRQIRGRNLFLGIPAAGYVVSTPEILAAGLV